MFAAHHLERKMSQLSFRLGEKTVLGVVLYCTGNILTRMLRVDFFSLKSFPARSPCRSPPRHPPPVSFFRLRPLFFRPLPSVPHFSSGREKPGEGEGRKSRRERSVLGRRRRRGGEEKRRKSLTRGLFKTEGWMRLQGMKPEEKEDQVPPVKSWSAARENQPFVLGESSGIGQGGGKSIFLGKTKKGLKKLLALPPTWDPGAVFPDPSKFVRESGGKGGGICLNGAEWGGAGKGELVVRWKAHSPGDCPKGGRRRGGGRDGSFWLPPSAREREIPITK